MIDSVNVLDHGFVRLRNLAGPTRRTTTLVPDHPGTEEEYASGSHSEERPFFERRGCSVVAKERCVLNDEAKEYLT